jgi:hypothetical protein
MLASLHQRLKPRRFRQIRALDHPTAAMVQSAYSTTLTNRRLGNLH